MTTRRVHFQLREDTYQRAVQAAAADHRTLSNWIAATVERILAPSVTGEHVHASIEGARGEQPEP
jgi:hypothetical protein